MAPWSRASGRLTALVGVVVLILPMTAHAIPAEPPRAHVRYHGERIQRAHLMASCWPNEDGAMGCGEESPMTWPRRDRVKTSELLRVRIQWKRKPTFIFVESYRRIGENGRPGGDGKRIAAVKRAFRRNGRIRAWDIVFSLHAERVHYVKVLVRYPETAVWNVHVRAVD